MSDTRFPFLDGTGKSPKRSYQKSLRKISSTKMEGHTICKLPKTDLALIITGVVLGILGTLSFFHIGILAHLGDMGSRYLAFGGWGGSALFFVIELTHRAIKRCSSKQKPPHKFSRGSLSSKPDQAFGKLIRKPPLPRTPAPQHYLTSSGGIFPSDLSELETSPVPLFAKDIREAQRKMSAYLKEAIAFGRSIKIENALSNQVREDLTQATKSLRKKDTTYRTQKSVSIATTQTQTYAMTELTFNTETAKFYSLSDPPTSLTLQFIKWLPGLVKKNLRGKKDINDKDIANALSKAIVDLNREFIRQFDSKPYEISGACLMVYKGKAYMANVGNCRIVHRRPGAHTWCVTQDTPFRLGYYEHSVPYSLELGIPQITSVDVEEGDTFVMANPNFWEVASINGIHLSFYFLEEENKDSVKDVATRLLSGAKKMGQEKPMTLLAIKGLC